MKFVLLYPTLIILTPSLHGQCDIETIPAPDGVPVFAQAVASDTGVIVTTGENSSGQDAIYVFEDTSWGWVLMDVLVGSDTEPEDGFGVAVAIEGSTILVGAPWEDEAGRLAGAVYVFERKGPYSWAQVQKLVPPNATGPETFGRHVSLSGAVAVIGAPLHDSLEGAAYVYRRVAGTWLLESKLLVAGNNIGIGMVAAVDGDRILLGAPGDDEQGFSAGAAFLFERSGGSWNPVAKLLPQQGVPEEQFGTALALEGDLALIGAPHNQCPAQDPGRVLAFTGPFWSEVGELTAPTIEGGDRFGKHLALEGNLAIVAASCAVADETVHWFRRGQGGWTWTGRTEGGSNGVALTGRRAAVTRDEDQILTFTVPNSVVESCFCGASAPCANGDPHAGCANSTGTGARLRACGSTSVAQDDLTLTAEGMPANQFGLVFMGKGFGGPFPFQDGLRCVGGALFRFPMRGTGPGGSFVEGPGIVAWADQNLFGGGSISPGDTWHFQAWYRDPLGPCGTDSNVTHAISVTFRL